MKKQLFAETRKTHSSQLSHCDLDEAGLANEFVL